MEHGRLYNYVMFVCNDQFIMENNSENKDENFLEFFKHVNGDRIENIIQWVDAHFDIEKDFKSITDEKLYIVVCDAIDIELADYNGYDWSSLAMDFEKLYSRNDWKR